MTNYYCSNIKGRYSRESRIYFRTCST